MISHGVAREDHCTKSSKSVHISWVCVRTVKVAICRKGRQREMTWVVRITRPGEAYEGGVDERG
jgi:hypothetical protein